MAVVAKKKKHKEGDVVGTRECGLCKDTEVKIIINNGQRVLGLHAYDDGFTKAKYECPASLWQLSKI